MLSLSLSLAVLCSTYVDTTEGWQLGAPDEGCDKLSIANAGQDVTGTIPTEFGYCTLVTSDFMVHQNTITGPIPTQVRSARHVGHVVQRCTGVTRRRHQKLASWVVV